MDRIKQFAESLRESALQDLDIGPLLWNLVLVLLLGQVLAWHYQRFSPVLSNKRKFARMFVLLAATTMLVISVVKTSLALSLGLVGALSIIRFRTPIKEPEELAYLFLAVALGIGLGADQRTATVIMFVVILGYLAMTSMGKAATLPPRKLVNVTYDSGDASDADGSGSAGSTDPEEILKRLLREVEDSSIQVDLRRVDVDGPVFNANLVVDLDSADRIGTLLSAIRNALPGARISVVEGTALD